MKINETVNDLLNDQVTNELFSAQLYFSAAGWCKRNSFNGAADWLYKHGKEELTHSHAFMEFTDEYGGCISLQVVPKPKSDWKNIREIFTLIAQHEDKVTTQIKEIANACLTAREHGVYTFVQKYNAEQLEEMAVSREHLDYLNIISDKDLFLFDEKLRKEAK